MSIMRSLMTGRQILLSNNFQPLKASWQARCVTLKAAPVPPPLKQTFEEKNEGVRPMSPHLLIYKPQLTSMMSISHRITGMMMTGYATALAFASFSSYDIVSLAESIKSIGLPGPITYTIKYILAFPCMYHLFNGIRHLMWDTGTGLTMKEVYLSGYITLALTVIFSLIVAK